MYDALNVLMAMNIISKEKKEIKWVGLPTNSAQECQQLEVNNLCKHSFDLRLNSSLCAHIFLRMPLGRQVWVFNHNNKIVS